MLIKIILRKGETLVARSEKRLLELRIILIEQMEKIYLNNNRQEELIDQMYGLNRQITNVEGSLLRLAENSGIKLTSQSLQKPTGTVDLTKIFLTPIYFKSSITFSTIPV